MSDDTMNRFGVAEGGWVGVLVSFLQSSIQLPLQMYISRPTEKRSL